MLQVKGSFSLKGNIIKNVLCYVLFISFKSNHVVFVQSLFRKNNKKIYVEDNPGGFKLKRLLG